jgi:hypothetical protein
VHPTSSPPEPPPQLGKRALRLRLWAIVGVWAVLAFPFVIIAFNGHENIESAQSYCPFKLATGMPCPGCGITKSLVFFYLGQWEKSISYHLFGPLVVAVSLVLTVLLLLEIVWRRDLTSSFLFRKNAGVVLGAGLAIYHASRLIYFLSTHSLSDILKESMWG